MPLTEQRMKFAMEAWIPRQIKELEEFPRRWIDYQNQKINKMYQKNNHNSSHYRKYGTKTHEEIG